MQNAPHRAAEYSLEEFQFTQPNDTLQNTKSSLRLPRLKTLWRRISDNTLQGPQMGLLTWSMRRA